MHITSNVSFEANKLVFAATSDFSANVTDTAVTFSASSALTLTPQSYSFGMSMLPSLQSKGGDSSFAGYGEGKSFLPKLYSSGDGGFYVPVALQIGSSSLPPLYSTGMLHTSSPGYGSSTLPRLFSKGGEGHYGESVNILPALRSYGSQGPSTDKPVLLSSAVCKDGMFIECEMVVIMNSSGIITDSFTATTYIISQLLDNLLAQDSYSVLGVITTDILSEVFGETRGFESLIPQGSTGDGIAFGESANVWVVNLDNNASSQYENYAFNDFFTEEGIDYGIAEDGIYSLNGDNDAGAYIDALIEIGRTHFGDLSKKKIINMYFGVGSDDKMYLKANADGNEYVYLLRSSSPDVQQHRADIGKGLNGVFWNLTLLNKEGCDFALATVSFEPLSTRRKI